MNDDGAEVVYDGGIDAMDKEVMCCWSNWVAIPDRTEVLILKSVSWCTAKWGERFGRGLQGFPGGIDAVVYALRWVVTDRRHTNYCWMSSPERGSGFGGDERSLLLSFSVMASLHARRGSRGSGALQ